MESFSSLEDLSQERRCRLTSTNMGLVQPKQSRQGRLLYPQQLSSFPSTVNSSFSVWDKPQLPFPLLFYTFWALSSIVVLG